MAKRDLHAAKLALKNRRATSVRARVVLAGRPSLLHAGQMVERLGLTVSIPGPLTRVHAVFPTALHRVASHPGVGHVIHVLHAVVHHGEPKQSTINKKVPQLSVLKKESRFQKKKKKIRSKKERQAMWMWQLEVSWSEKNFTDYTEPLPHPPPPGRIGKQRFMTTQSSNLTLHKSSNCHRQWRCHRLRPCVLHLQ